MDIKGPSFISLGFLFLVATPNEKGVISIIFISLFDFIIL